MSTHNEGVHAKPVVRYGLGPLRTLFLILISYGVAWQLLSLTSLSMAAQQLIMATIILLSILAGPTLSGRLRQYEMKRSLLAGPPHQPLHPSLCSARDALLFAAICYLMVRLEYSWIAYLAASVSAGFLIAAIWFAGKAIRGP